METKSRNSNDNLQQLLKGKSLAFIGMMGCGKSAIGRMVANKFKLPFADSDSEIELAAGRSVAEIFEEFGEAEFRRLEERVIERVLLGGPLVLALGGGAYMSPTTRQLVRKHAIAIWLKADIGLLVSRVAKRPGKRPLLATGDPHEILSNLLKERKRAYGKADLHVMTSGGSKSETREKVIEALRDWVANRPVGRS